MYIPGMFLYVGTVSHAVQATVIESRTGVIFWFSGQTNCEAGVEREYLPPSGVHVWLLSLALPFPVRLPEKREKITPVRWDRFIYLFH